jgi:hypothetical protein
MSGEARAARREARAVRKAISEERLRKVKLALEIRREREAVAAKALGAPADLFETGRKRMAEAEAAAPEARVLERLARHGVDADSARSLAKGLRVSLDELLQRVKLAKSLGRIT